MPAALVLSIDADAVVGVEDHGGTKAYDITYASPVGDRGSMIGPNGGLVSAYLIVPAGKGPFPAVIYGHWCMPGSDKMNRTEFLAEALVITLLGGLAGVVLAYIVSWSVGSLTLWSAFLDNASEGDIAKGLFVVDRGFRSSVRSVISIDRRSKIE